MMAPVLLKASFGRIESTVLTTGYRATAHDLALTERVKVLADWIQWRIYSPHFHHQYRLTVLSHMPSQTVSHTIWEPIRLWSRQQHRSVTERATAC